MKYIQIMMIAMCIVYTDKAFASVNNTELLNVETVEQKQQRLWHEEPKNKDKKLNNAMLLYDAAVAQQNKTKNLDCSEKQYLKLKPKMSYQYLCTRKRSAAEEERRTVLKKFELLQGVIKNSVNNTELLDAKTFFLKFKDVARKQQVLCNKEFRCKYDKSQQAMDLYDAVVKEFLNKPVAQKNKIKNVEQLERLLFKMASKNVQHKKQSFKLMPKNVYEYLINKNLAIGEWRTACKKLESFEKLIDNIEKDIKKIEEKLKKIS